MTDDRLTILEILHHNQGFEDPDDWVEYAQKHGFKKVRAQKRTECPDCLEPRHRTLGQYVYYSQLIRVNRCAHCDLYWIDVLIDREVLREHFETAYKDERYFRELRRPIFQHISRIISRHCPGKKSIIDVGGATGHLAVMLHACNREYFVTVNDLSVNACRIAREQFGLKTICCTIGDLKDYHQKFDVALVIDSIYYVADIKRAWESLSACLNQEGTMLLRLPNKMWWIEPLQRLKRLLGMNQKADRVYGLNPEHVYMFIRSYLKKRLTRLGFKKIVFCPSPPLHCERKSAEFLSRIMYGACLTIYHLSLRRLCISPSQLVLACRKG